MYTKQCVYINAYIYKMLHIALGPGVDEAVLLEPWEDSRKVCGSITVVRRASAGGALLKLSNSIEGMVVFVRSFGVVKRRMLSSMCDP